MNRLLSNPHLVVVNEDLAALDRISDFSVSVTLVHLNQASASTFPAAVAEAGMLDDHWWVSRVLVRTPGERGKGLGSIALQRMLSCIAKCSRLPVRVAPGGYDAQTEKQFSFYEKNGFVAVSAERGLLEWRSQDRT